MLFEKGLPDILSRLRKSEIDAWVANGDNGAWLVAVGDHRRGRVAEEIVPHVDAVAPMLSRLAWKEYPDSDFAIAMKPSAPGIHTFLTSCGLPGLWVD